MMKKNILSILYVLTILLFITACGKQNGANTQKASLFPSPTVTVTPLPTATITPLPTVTVTPSPTVTPTPSPTAAPIDTTPPVLTVGGEAETKVIARSEFNGFTFHAEDDTDGNLTDSVLVSGEVDVNLCGTYSLTYSVSDTAGNTASIERNIEVIQPAEVIPEDKTIYLTFDDGPGQFTTGILDLLAKHNIKATFFACGTGHPDLIKKIHEAGHTIGAHCNNHDYDVVYASEDAYFEDLKIILDLIYDNTGVHTTLIRFPGGSSNTISYFNPKIMTRLTTRVEQMGYQYFDWNVGSGDSGKADSKTILNNLKEGAVSHSYSIILLHSENKQYSYEVLDDFIIWAFENGYTFRTLDPTSPKTHHVIAN